MDDFFGLLLFGLVYFLYVLFGGKKKKPKKNKRSPRRKPQARPVFFEEAEEVEAVQPTREADCEGRPIHLHEVSQQEMAFAGEGEDPCHAGGAPEIASFEEDMQEESTLAQDVLRGVIMSEILARPQQRAAMNRRRTNG